MAFRPGDPDVVYAALWQTRRPPWSVYPPSNGPGSGLYRSADGGRELDADRGHGLPANPRRIGIAAGAFLPGRVYALVDAPRGLACTARTMRRHLGPLPPIRAFPQRGWYFSGITVDPGNADMVYVCDTILADAPTMAAAISSPLKGAPGGDDYHTLWIDPKNTARRMLGVDQGAIVTLNGGADWSTWFNQPTGQFYHVITDSRFPTASMARSRIPARPACRAAPTARRMALT